jgi:hypothetical protein
MQVLPHENDADDRDRGRGRNHGTRMNMKKANAARTQSGTFQSAWQEPDMPMTYF